MYYSYLDYPGHVYDFAIISFSENVNQAKCLIYLIFNFLLWVLGSVFMILGYSYCKWRIDLSNLLT